MSAFMVFGVSYSSLRPVAEGCIKRQILNKKKLDRSYEMTQDEYVAAVNAKQSELWQKNESQSQSQRRSVVRTHAAITLKSQENPANSRICK